MTLNDFKNEVQKLINERYNKNSTDSFYCSIKNNDKNSVIFWNDCTQYYKDINTKEDAIMHLTIGITSLTNNNKPVLNMTSTYYNVAALIYSIFVKFFTKTDFKYYYNFYLRLYNQRSNNNSRKIINCYLDKFELIKKLLEVGK